MNKIGLLSAVISDKEQLELIFKERLQNGDELFFAPDEISAKQMLALGLNFFFIDASFYDRKETFWEKGTQHLIVIRAADEKQGLEHHSMTRPLQAKDVLRLTTAWLEESQIEKIRPL